MALGPVATAQSSLVLCLFLFVFSVLSEPTGVTFTANELLNIRLTTPSDLKPDFSYSTDVLDILLTGAAALYGRFRRRRRGKRAGARVRLQQRGFRTPLPSIHLANVRSLGNKMDEILLLNGTNKSFSCSAALCFTETWLSETTPDCALWIPGFHLHRADRVTELTGKSRGGGVCFYINEGWCTDVTELKKHCCPELESLFINCKPFYSPREFSSTILVAVYIPPGACALEAQRRLADQITSVEQNHPDSVIIILGDFNRANLSRELPKYRQLIKCPTRGNNILDHCYSTLKGSYRALPRAALGHSDHNLVQLIPTYRQELKTAKPVVRTVKKWTREGKDTLHAGFDCTDWSVFEQEDQEEMMYTIKAYVSFCEDLCIPTKTYARYNNTKPWFSNRLRQLWQAKNEAHRGGDRALYNQARNTLTKEIRLAKAGYSEKLKNRFSANDPASVWRGLRDITNYRTPPPHTTESQQLVEDLNVFYCRFERPMATPLPRSTSHPAPITPTAPTLPCTASHLALNTMATTPPLPPTSLPPLKISVEDVCRQFKSLKTRKAAGEDGVSPTCLKVCAEALAPIFTRMFNTSLELCVVPPCLKQSTIVPIPKKHTITGLNDYRPVALTSVVMKTFERLVLGHLKSITGPLLDPLQFAYRANRSVDDAVNMGLHHILHHLDRPGTYARILFLDFSSAFNTIIPELLHSKLSQLSVPASTCQWITSFLTDRTQQVRLGKFTSSTRSTSTGAPQGCVLSPLLFSLYTNDCTSSDPSVKLLKFADDTTIIGLISDGDESAYRGEVDRLALWCSHNNLELNTLKTVEMIVDFRKQPPPLTPLTIQGSTVAAVETFKFLGTTISRDLKWETNIVSITKKAQQRMYFLRQLRKFNLPQDLLVQFYSAVIESVLTNSITVWFGTATKQDTHRLQRIIRSAERIIGLNLPSLQDLFTSRARKRAGKIIADPSHPGHNIFELLPSGRRYRALFTRTSRHRDSFFPHAITLMNN